MMMKLIPFTLWDNPLFEEHNGLSTKAIKFLAIIHEINIMGANGRL
jgi:hypothetical protein